MNLPCGPCRISSFILAPSPAPCPLLLTRCLITRPSPSARRRCRVLHRLAGGTAAADGRFDSCTASSFAPSPAFPRYPPFLRLCHTAHPPSPSHHFVSSHGPGPPSFLGRHNRVFGRYGLRSAPRVRIRHGCLTHRHPCQWPESDM